MPPVVVYIVRSDSAAVCVGRGSASVLFFSYRFVRDVRRSRLPRRFYISTARTAMAVPSKIRD